MPCCGSVHPLPQANENCFLIAFTGCRLSLFVSLALDVPFILQDQPRNFSTHEFLPFDFRLERIPFFAHWRISSFSEILDQFPAFVFRTGDSGNFEFVGGRFCAGEISISRKIPFGWTGDPVDLDSETDYGGAHL